MLDDVRVLDRKVLHALLEVFDGVTVSLHHRLDELVRRADGARRIIDETGLDRAPLALEAQALRLAQGVQVQAIDAILPLGELAFRALLVAVFRHGPRIFRTEALPKLDVAPA